MTEALRIPDRYRVPCELCREPLDTRAFGVYRLTHGWVMQRAGGGGHGVSDATYDKPPKWAHGRCVELKVAGLLDQGSLFQ